MAGVLGAKLQGKLLVFFLALVAILGANPSTAGVAHLSGGVAANLCSAENIPALYILCDPEGKLTFSRVSDPAMNGRFSLITNSHISQGITPYAYWLRFRVETGSHDDLFLEIGKSLVSRIDLYLPLKGGYELVEAGILRPREADKYNYRNFVFKIPWDYQRDGWFYLRLESGFPLTFPLRVWCVRGLLNHAYWDVSLFGAIYGVFACMIVFNLATFITLRDRSHFYYVFYVGSMLLYQLTAFGQMGIVFDLGRLTHGLVMFFISCAFFGGALFSKTFLSTRVYAPYLDRVFNGVMALSVLLFLLSVCGFNHLAEFMAHVMGVCCPALAISTAWLCLRRGFRPARYYLLAWMVLSVGVLAYAAQGLGFMQHSFFTTHTLTIGLALEAVILAFALADRMRIMRLDSKELEASKRRYQELSEQDSLTRLYNMGYFRRRLAQELGDRRRENRPFCLLMLDLDDFKAFNDAHGHPEGDQVLVALARVIRSVIRNGDQACRYGGEEFAVILPRTTIQDAMQVSERIHLALGDMAFYPDGYGPVQVTASIGLASLQPGDTPESLLKRADQALYEAKRAGKNQTVAA